MTLSPPSSSSDIESRTDAASPLPSVRAKRSWRDKFRVAIRGVKFGIRGHSSFAVHFFFAALVLVAGAVFRISVTEWCQIVFCIGLVLTAELFNSCVETLFRCLDDRVRDQAWPCLDIAAGAVLLASVTAAVIGLIIFLPKLADLLHVL